MRRVPGQDYVAVKFAKPLHCMDLQTTAISNVSPDDVCVHDDNIRLKPSSAGSSSTDMVGKMTSDNSKTQMMWR